MSFFFLPLERKSVVFWFFSQRAQFRMREWLAVQLAKEAHQTTRAGRQHEGEGQAESGLLSAKLITPIPSLHTQPASRTDTPQLGGFHPRELPLQASSAEGYQPAACFQSH